MRTDSPENLVGVIGGLPSLTGLGSGRAEMEFYEKCAVSTASPSITKVDIVCSFEIVVLRPPLSNEVTVHRLVGFECKLTYVGRRCSSLILFAVLSSIAIFGSISVGLLF